MIAGTTGVGSLPGTDAAEAMRLAFGEALDIPYMAELPARGPGADMIGRAAARLVDLPVELTASGWRLTGRKGIDLARAADFWSWDLDALHQVADGYAGPLKLQIAGPWTLAATLELPNGHAVLTDHGAVRDLHDSFAAGVTELIGDIVRRVPGAATVVQLDEPALPAVLSGAVPTASGFGRIGAVGVQECASALSRFVDALGAIETPPLVHSCAARVPFTLLQQSGIGAVMIDASLVQTRDYDDLGEAIDQGLGLFAGVVSNSTEPTAAAVDAAAKATRSLASAVGIAPDEVGDRVGITPACGLAGTTLQRARAISAATRAVARQVRDNPRDGDE